MRAVARTQERCDRKGGLAAENTEITQGGAAGDGGSPFGLPDANAAGKHAAG